MLGELIQFLVGNALENERSELLVFRQDDVFRRFMELPESFVKGVVQIVVCWVTQNLISDFLCFSSFEETGGADGLKAD